MCEIFWDILKFKCIWLSTITKNNNNNTKIDFNHKDIVMY